MRGLWIASAVLIVYVSIFPFDFHYRAIDGPTLRTLAHSLVVPTSRGDILGNFVLFVPFGVLGMLAARPGAAVLRRLAVVGAWGFALAIALQLVQLYLPSRDATLQDVVWNGAGTALGAALGVAAARRGTSSGFRAENVRLVPLALVASWVFYRLIPFVPAIDLQEIKDSLKPLLLHPRWSPGEILGDAVPWLVVAYLLRRVRPRRSLSRHLPSVIVVVYALEVLIERNTLDVADVAGAAVAVAVWFGWLRRVRRPARWLVPLLLLDLAFAGLAPFELRTAPLEFGWLPFGGFLYGSMWVNAQSACQKLFEYGALVYLLGRAGIRRVPAGAFGAVFVLSIEVAQRYVTGHVPEITDPLLVVVAALAVAVLEHRDREIASRDPSLGRSAAPAT